VAPRTGGGMREVFFMASLHAPVRLALKACCANDQG